MMNFKPPILQRYMLRNICDMTVFPEAEFQTRFKSEIRALSSDLLYKTFQTVPIETFKNDNYNIH